MARSRFGHRAVGGPKRAVQWVGPADQNVISVASGASAIVASFDPGGNSMIRPTIVRTRGMVSIRPQSFAGDLSIGGAFGVAIVSDEAFAAGTASIPRPFDDANWGGWMVWRSFFYQLEFADVTGFIIGDRVLEVDSKAMRKVGDNETVVLMVESQTGAFNIGMHLRQLFKLS